ncbi:MAG: flavodoxin family protein [Eggerthellaceae bacterium]
MKILAINGSHRVGQNTATLLQIALDEAAVLGAETEMVDLAELDIEFCAGCNRCLGKQMCSISDDMDELKQKMLEADGIILGSPDYFSNVTARTKNFIDRTRPLHMVANQLKGKVGGYLTMSGLDNCGSETTNRILDNFFATHEMIVIHPRPEGPVLGSGITGSLMAGMKDGKPRWRRSVEEDEIALKMAHQLGKDMAEMIQRLA